MPRLKVKEAAAYIPLAVSTLNALRVSGGGPVYLKVKGKVLYDTRDLDAWLETKKQHSTSENISAPPRRPKSAA